MAKVQFRNEDCFKTMQKFIDNSKTVDIILTSPPYNIGKKYGKYSDKIADNKIKRGFFCKILVFLAIKCENVI